MFRKRFSKILILLFFFFCSFTEDKLLQTIIAYLNKATNYEQIVTLYKLLENNKEKYKEQLNYIPSYSPLNPDKTKRYSDLFGNRFHPIDNKIKKHLGIDISAKYGTPVHATASGKVINISESNTGYGKKVIIQHKYGFQTLYAHLYTIYVKKDDMLRVGDVIGFVGSTGTSTASHLHYEVIKNKTNLDPYPFCFLYLLLNEN